MPLGNATRMLASWDNLRRSWAIPRVQPAQTMGNAGPPHTSLPERHMSRTKTPQTLAPWAMLFARTLLFAVFQLAVAGLLFLWGSSGPWKESQAWWLITVLATNIVVVYLLARLQRREGKGYFDLFNFRRSTFWSDLLITVVILLVALPIATLPVPWLARQLFRSPDAPLEIMFRELPRWAALLGLAMPVTQAFAEMPTYFGYSMPHLAAGLGRPWLAWLVSSLALAFQHIAIPLVLDPRFMAWRVGMFVPLAFLIGLCIKLRPSLLAFVVVGHALVDLPLVFIVLNLSI